MQTHLTTEDLGAAINNIRLFTEPEHPTAAEVAHVAAVRDWLYHSLVTIVELQAQARTSGDAGVITAANERRQRIEELYNEFVLATVRMGAIHDMENVNA